MALPPPQLGTVDVLPLHELTPANTLYVLGELDGNVYSVPVPKPSSGKGGDKLMTPVSKQPYWPPCLDAAAARERGMLGAELLLHNGQLLASNRAMLHGSIKDAGDAIAVIPLDGTEMQKPSWVRTGCCCVRGLSVSPDGKFAAVGGQCNGVVEIYELGQNWNKVASASVQKPVAFLWL